MPFSTVLYMLVLN
jgi:hypothetical protein